MPRRRQRCVLQGAAVASVLSGTPSFGHAVATGGLRSALAYGVDATRAVGTLLPPGRPGLVRGAVTHAAISLASAELLAYMLPREHSVAWGTFAGLLLGVVNLGLIAPRWFPLIAEFELGPQIADNVAFGAIFAAVADR